MNRWYTVGIKYDKMQEDGKEKRVTEYLLIDALSFSEAEARATEEVQPFISGEFVVESIKKEKLSEVFLSDDGDKYYKVKINFVTLDEKSGREKKTPAFMLVQAPDIDTAKTLFAERMKGTLADYVVEGITETKIMDVYQYEAQEGGES